MKFDKWLTDQEKTCEKATARKIVTALFVCAEGYGVPPEELYKAAEQALEQEAPR